MVAPLLFLGPNHIDFIKSVQMKWLRRASTGLLLKLCAVMIVHELVRFVWLEVPCTLSPLHSRVWVLALLSGVFHRWSFPWIASSGYPILGWSGKKQTSNIISSTDQDRVSSRTFEIIRHLKDWHFAHRSKVEMSPPQKQFSILPKFEIP